MLGRAPAFQVRALKPVARFTATRRSSWCARTLRGRLPGFIAAAKRRRQAEFRLAGNYGTMHIPMAMLMLGADVKMTHVPYTGPARPSRPPRRTGRCARHRTGNDRPARASGKSARSHTGGRAAGSVARRAEPKELGMPIDFAQWAGCSCLPTRRAGRHATARGCACRSNDPRSAKCAEGGQPVLYRIARFSEVRRLRRAEDGGGREEDRSWSSRRWPVHRDRTGRPIAAQ